MFDKIRSKGGEPVELALEKVSQNPKDSNAKEGLQKKIFEVLSKDQNLASEIEHVIININVDNINHLDLRNHKATNIKLGEPTMTEDNKPEGRIFGGPGINAGGDVIIGDVNGQFAVGANIFQGTPLSTADIEKLKESLLNFQEEISKMDLSPEDKETITGDVNAALREAKKEEPKLQKIKNRVENVIETLKEAGKTVKNISEISGSLKILVGLLGISF